MLYLSLISLFLINAVEASSSCPVGALLPNACEISKETLESVCSFQEELTQKNTHLLEDFQFQEIVAELRKQAPASLKKEERPHEGQFYIFVSFSLGEKALLSLAQEAKHYSATLVLRGFREGSFRKTVNTLHKIILKTGQGVMIDPELFTLFNIAAVPTFVLAKAFPLEALERTQTPRHDCLQGHVGVRYVLETFAKEGNLKEEAESLLWQGENS